MSSFLIDKLQEIQNISARVITKSPFDTTFNLLLRVLIVRKAVSLSLKQNALIMYKTMNELAPEYLQLRPFHSMLCCRLQLGNLEGTFSAQTKY